MPESFLERIVAATRADLAVRQAETPLEALRARLADAPPPRNFAAALEPLANGSARLVAEVKRASPSKGLLAERFDPVAQARAYEAGGAAAISVLTEPRYFLGSLDHLRAVRQAVRLPVLRKDFILDPYQVYEARVAGADAVLLLCSLLDDSQLRDLLQLTSSLGMDALVESHDEDEVRRAVAVGAHIVGVNARDLRTFAVNMNIVRRLRAHVPRGRIFVAESGIATPADAASARAFGADAILVGEALMRAPDPAAKARELASAPGGTLAAFFAPARHPFVKICGLTQPEHAALVARLGADAFGLVFASVAPLHRRVTPAQARAIAAAARHNEGSQHGGHGEDGEDGENRGAREDNPRSIGVFVNERPNVIEEIAAEVGLDAIQLSGDESLEDCASVMAQVRRPVIKVLRPRTADDLARVDEYALAGAVPLVDTPRDGMYGGSGETGDWALVREAAARWPIILAGGLTPENVADAIRTVGQRGVDVSSGVETDRAKDPSRIAAFIAAARHNGESTSNTEAAEDTEGRREERKSQRGHGV